MEPKKIKEKERIYNVPESNCFEARIFDTKQLFLPITIREKLNLKPQQKLKLAVVAVIEEHTTEIPATSIKTKVEENTNERIRNDKKTNN